MPHVLRLLIAVMVALGSLNAAEGSPASAAAPASETGAEVAPENDIGQLLEWFNPYQNADITSGFTDPASDIAEEVQEAAWFSGLIFLPFLIIPQILLLVVIFKFRDRGDGRKPATFVHNNKLEITWTAIPVVALIIVSIPLTVLLYKHDLPPAEAQSEDALSVRVTGKQFSWIWEYPQYGIENALEAGVQLPMVLEKDRLVNMQVQSIDVNHAWAVPAFGVKRDAFPRPRWNYIYFTPTRTGWFEGQCYELCGEGHGKMVFGVRVVETPVYQRWVRLEQDRPDARPVIAALTATDDDASEEEEQALTDALVDYFALDRSAERQFSLRYWAAFDYFLRIERLRMTGAPEAEVAAVVDLAAEQRGTLRGLMEQVLSQPPPEPEGDGEPESDDAGAESDSAEEEN